MDSIGQVMSKVDIVSLFNTVTGILGGGPFAWVMSVILSGLGIFFYFKLKGWMKKEIYKETQQEVVQTQQEVKKEEKKISEDFSEAEKKTAQVVAEQPPQPEKPHRPTPAKTVE